MAIKQLETSSEPIDRIGIVGPQIMLNGKQIGVIDQVQTKNYSKERLAKALGTSIESFSKWKIPERFDYAYVEGWKIYPSQRGKGLGAKVLQTYFKSFHTPTLVCLVPGVIDKDVSLQFLLQFYKSQGMYLVRIGQYTYAFKWVTG